MPTHICAFLISLHIKENLTPYEILDLKLFPFKTFWVCCYCCCFGILLRILKLAYLSFLCSKIYFLELYMVLFFYFTQDTFRHKSFSLSRARWSHSVQSFLRKTFLYGFFYCFSYSILFCFLNTISHMLGFPSGSDGKEFAMQETQVWSLGWKDPLEKGMATHSSILDWDISWTEEPGRLQSMGLQRVGLNWACTHLMLAYKHVTHWVQ